MFIRQGVETIAASLTLCFAVTVLASAKCMSPSGTMPGALYPALKSVGQGAAGHK